MAFLFLFLNKLTSCLTLHFPQCCGLNLHLIMKTFWSALLQVQEMQDLFLWHLLKTACYRDNIMYNFYNKQYLRKVMASVWTRIGSLWTPGFLFSRDSIWHTQRIESAWHFHTARYTGMALCLVTVPVRISYWDRGDLFLLRKQAAMVDVHQKRKILQTHCKICWWIQGVCFVTGGSGHLVKIEVIKNSVKYQDILA